MNIYIYTYIYIIIFEVFFVYIYILTYTLNIYIWQPCRHSPVEGPSAPNSWVGTTSSRTGGGPQPLAFSELLDSVIKRFGSGDVVVAGDAVDATVSGDFLSGRFPGPATKGVMCTRLRRLTPEASAADRA